MTQVIFHIDYIVFVIFDVERVLNKNIRLKLCDYT